MADTTTDTIHGVIYLVFQDGGIYIVIGMDFEEPIAMNYVKEASDYGH